MSDCCQAPAEPPTEGSRPRCQHCGREGKPVARITIEALLKPAARTTLNGSPSVFCETPTCPVVYYTADGIQFRKEQIRVRVGLKETEDPISVCYCFGITERMIREEMQRTGRSLAATRIRAEVKAGTCRCEGENPSGRCCLGDIRQAEQRAAAERSGSSHDFARS